MKKYILSTALCTLIALNAQAQDGDLVSGFMGDSIASETHEVKKSDKQVADDRGAFSFLKSHPKTVV